MDTLLNTLENNIIKWFNLATENEVKSGLTWYADTHLQACELAHEHDLPLTSVCGLLSVLSPRCAWNRTVEHTKIVCATQQTDTLKAQLNISREKAKAIINGTSALKVLNGAPKTTSFYHNILNAGKDNHVTLDVWAIRAAYDNPEHKAKAVRQKEYSLVSQAYQNAAAKVDITPPELQAIVWVVIRNRYGLPVHNNA